MFFRSFESLEREAIKEQLELSLKSHTSTIVFVFWEVLQKSKVFEVQTWIRENFPSVTVCSIVWGNIMNNGNLVSDSLVTVTILSGMFQHRVRVLDDNNLDDVDPENLSWVLLFGFWSTNPEADLRKCEFKNFIVPVVGGSFRYEDIEGVFNGVTIENQSVAIFCYGDIVFQTKAFNDVLPIGNSFVIGKTEGTTVYSMRWLSALKYFNTIFGDSYVHQVLQKKTLEFPLLVTRNGMYASRTITGIDFSKQNITWSGNILEGEEAFLGMLSSEQIASSVNYCTSFLNCTRHEGGFIFSNQSRYSLLWENLAWNLQPNQRNGLIGVFSDISFTPFHGSNECLSQALVMVLISDSATSSIPDYAVRDISEKHSENLSLNSFNLLQSVLQKQLIQNTSEKKELTEAIQEGNKRIDYLQNSQQEALIKIIDNAPLAIWMGDKDERTVYANSLFAELVGYTKDEMQGMESFDFWSPESIATVQNNNEVRIQWEKSTYEADLLSKNKELIPVRLTGIPIPTGTVGMMLDLRELRKEELQRAALQRLSDSKDSFLNIASHELRTPITSILGYISMLIDGDYGDLPEPAVKALNIVQSSGKRLFNIINHMLQLAKLESGNIVLREEPVKLRDICESIMHEVHAIALERNIQMEFQEISLNEAPIIIGDNDQVRKAILNLVGNSLKFTQGWGKVDLALKKQGNEMVLSVTDNGVGIPEKDHHKIFEKFAQSENAMTRTYEGTGLGLAFVKEIITQMHGRIELKSEVGKGSCFSIYFTRLPE